MQLSTMDRGTEGLYLLRSLRGALFLTSTFPFNAENLALPVGKEGQREDVVCSYCALHYYYYFFESLKLSVHNLKTRREARILMGRFSQTHFTTHHLVDGDIFYSA